MRANTDSFQNEPSGRADSHSFTVFTLVSAILRRVVYEPDGRENRHVCSVVIQKENHASLKISLGSFSSFISQEILEMKFSKFIMIIKKNYIDKECTKNKI